jgi:hypothetical protein
MSTDYDILVAWTIDMLRYIKADGEVIVPDNSPLSSEDVARGLRAVSLHPNYKSQTVSVPDEKGVRTILRRKSDGQVEIETLPFADEPHERRMPDGTGIFVRTEEDEDERT